MDTTPLPNFGAVVSDVNLATLDGEGAREVKRQLYEHKLLLFRDVELSPTEYLAMARHLGSLVKFVDEDYRHPEHPEIFVVSNVKRNGVKFGMDRVGYYWHSDSSFMPNPLPITMLYAQHVPREGGETAFIDMTHVYSQLDADTRALVDRSSCSHEGKWRYLITPSDVGLSVQEILERDERLVPSPTHPMMIAHPETGSRALYWSEGISKRVIGLSESESTALLEKVTALVHRDESRYVHSWQPGELVLWDNRSLVHQAYPAAPGQARMMFRIGINDGPFFAASRGAEHWGVGGKKE
jgi:taurine dioxygenase